MEKIYIVLIGTPGIFAAMIRFVIKLDYVHVVLGMDENLKHCYSFGRRDPRVPFLSGFERENMKIVIQKFPHATCKVLEMDCTKEQKEKLWDLINYYYKNRKKYHYTVLGLPLMVWGIKFHQKRHYTCSQFLGRILEICKIRKFNKHYSLLTPRDFYEMDDLKVIYEGKLIDFISNNNK